MDTYFACVISCCLGCLFVFFRWLYQWYPHFSRSVVMDILGSIVSPSLFISFVLLQNYIILAHFLSKLENYKHLTHPVTAFLYEQGYCTVSCVLASMIHNIAECCSTEVAKHW